VAPDLAGASPVSRPTTTTSNNNNNNNNSNSNNNNNNNNNNNPRSIGEAIQQESDVEGLLEVAAKMWLPSDPDLKPHLKTQSVHHEKRQRWAGQLLAKWGDGVCSTSGRIIDVPLLWDPRLVRAVNAAALPFSSSSSSSNIVDDSNNDKEHRAVREALLGLHTIVGHITSTTTAAGSVNSYQSTNLSNALMKEFFQATQALLERALAMANDLSFTSAIEVRWAAKGLQVRINHLVIGEDRTDTVISCGFDTLDQRVKRLPFDIIPMGIDVQSADLMVHQHTARSNDGTKNGEMLMQNLQECIPFHFDTIVTRQGTSVVERRGTAWVAEEGIGALAYSGKLMKPHPMPDLVRAIMRQVESILYDPAVSPGQPFFDCALCNYYPDGETSCRFHTDPEHGTMWDRLNVVVSVGNPRRFAFRPIPDITTWNEWDNYSVDSRSNKVGGDADNAPVVIRFFPGDIVSMWGSCNDDFHHAVYPESTSSMVGSRQEDVDISRISLVLKRAMVNGKGRRGHGNMGEGRRSRRKQDKTNQLFS